MFVTVDHCINRYFCSQINKNNTWRFVWQEVFFLNNSHYASALRSVSSVSKSICSCVRPEILLTPYLKVLDRFYQTCINRRRRWTRHSHFGVKGQSTEVKVQGYGGYCKQHFSGAGIQCWRDVWRGVKPDTHCIKLLNVEPGYCRDGWPSRDGYMAML